MGDHAKHLARSRAPCLRHLPDLLSVQVRLVAFSYEVCACKHVASSWKLCSWDPRRRLKRLSGRQISISLPVRQELEPLPVRHELEPLRLGPTAALARGALFAAIASVKTSSKCVGRGFDVVSRIFRGHRRQGLSANGVYCKIRTRWVKYCRLSSCDCRLVSQQLVLVFRLCSTRCPSIYDRIY